MHLFSQQPQEAVQAGQDGGELWSSSEDAAEKPDGDSPQPKAETNCAAADTVNGEGATETNTTSMAVATAETMGKVGCGSHHCLQHEPSDTSSAIPSQPGSQEPGLESAATAGEGPLEGQAAGEGEAAAVPAVVALGNQHGLGSRAATPELREVNLQDGSEQVTRDHVTRCPFTLENILLFELD